MRTCVATFQTVWDCRWSRPGHRVVGVDESQQPESRWVCIYNGQRRPVRDEECETCDHWQRTDASTN